ncbi:serine hydrolase [Bacillus lacus]|uniref:Serine hydrolase n=1 Tax=Metabacillus lacus TaxID=1983721 RepID=A0A7X2LYY3_9BACI|nr:serine hydrolase domain-containing protein [Metabacillus lacus]MRX72308.1 serine hydrolase [Metabacillus lacus]
MKRLLIIIPICFLLCISFSPFTASAEEVDQIKNLISKEVQKGKIPGVSVVVIKNGKVLLMDSYNNPSYKSSINRKTKFEIASNSKAFTGLGMMKLVEQGEIDLDDNVKQYIPWLQFVYKDKPVDILVKDFLYHTSGIPANSVANIPITNKKNGLEQTIRKLNGMNLNSLPGVQFEYATFNYDVLGLIIERVSGEAYADYMKEEIFKPLDLNHTSINILTPEENTQGYKRGFFTSIKYNAPTYSGNIPAGYISSNIIDMSKWLQIQLHHTKSDMSNIINGANDKSSFIDGTLNYSSGWMIHKKNNDFFHEGNNPNYSSFILFNKEKNFGVAVLANSNSVYTSRIAYRIQNLLYSTKTELPSYDYNTAIDTFSTITMIISLAFSLFLVFKLQMLYKNGYKIKDRKLKYSLLILCILFLSIEISLIILAPKLLMGYNWKFLVVWMPFSFLPAVICSGILILMLNLFGFFFLFFKKGDINGSNNILQ